MLLRRLRDRVAAGPSPSSASPPAPRSATGREPSPTSPPSCSTLPFEWVDERSGAVRTWFAPAGLIPAGPFWGPLAAADYLRLAATLATRRRAALAASRGMRRPGADARRRAARRRGSRMASSAALLASGPLPFTGLAATSSRRARRSPRPRWRPLVDARQRGSRDSDGHAGAVRPVPPVRAGHRGRVHLPVAPGPHVPLARHEMCPDCAAAVFEFGCCKRCGAVHLAGTVDRDAAGECFTSRVTRGDRRSLAAARRRRSEAATDEDDEALEDAADDRRRRTPCCAAGCGALHAVRAVARRALAAAPGRAAVPPRTCGRSAGCRRVAATPRGCLVCGARGTGMVRLFESGNDASAAVLATALYQALPADEEPGRTAGRRSEAARVQRQQAGRRVLRALPGGTATRSCSSAG